MEATLSVAPAIIPAYVALKLLTGLRRGDLLRLRIQDIYREDGLFVQPRKTTKTSGVRLTIEWTDGLRAAIDATLTAWPKDILPGYFARARENPTSVKMGQPTRLTCSGNVG